MSVELTKSAKHSISVIYKEYQSRIKNGETKSAARYFCNSCQNYTSLKKTVGDDIAELKSVGFVKSFILGDFELTNSGIIFMENKTIDTIKEWLSFGAQFIP